MHFQFLAWNAKSQLPDALHAVPKLVIGGWAWVYNTAATIRQRSKMHTDAKVLEAKPSLNWKGPLKSSQLASVPLLTSWTAPFSALSSYIWIYSRHARRGYTPARLGTTLQALCQPARPWRHAEVFASGVDAICAKQFLQEIPPIVPVSYTHLTLPTIYSV